MKFEFDVKKLKTNMHAYIGLFGSGLVLSVIIGRAFSIIAGVSLVIIAYVLVTDPLKKKPKSAKSPRRKTKSAKPQETGKDLNL